MSGPAIEAERPAGGTAVATHDPSIGRDGIDAQVLLAWAVVAIPLAWGLWTTAEKAVKLFS